MIGRLLIGAYFWNKEGDARAGAVGTWQTNCALIGGLLIAAAHSFQ